MTDSRGPLSGRKIALFPRYTELGPSSRLRMNQYEPALRAAGAQVESHPFFDDQYLSRYFRGEGKSLGGAVRGYARRAAALMSGNADLIWVEKEFFPFLPGLFERFGVGRPPVVVVDFDDAVFHTYDRSANPVVRKALGQKFDSLLRGCAAATVGNGYLETYVRDHGAPETVRIPTVVDLARYPFVPAVPSPMLRVGWIGTPANAEYLRPVAAAMDLLRDRHPMTLVTVGAPKLDFVTVAQEANQWSADTEAALLSTLDVGVMPLKDSAFERGKCGYKLIQYMAAGRAVIASPVGVNREIVDPSVGLLAETVDDWCLALSHMAQEAEKRVAMGHAGRAKVERDYSLAAIAPRVVTLFSRLIETDK